MNFQFYPVRFHFRAAGTLHFPPLKSANILRGAFGATFRKLVCVPECTGARDCPSRATCPYARIFEPRAAGRQGPSGLADWPRPFVFRAAHLDGLTVPEAAAFHFDLHLFDTRDPAFPHYVHAFAELARQGLGPGRGRAELTAVDQLSLGGTPIARLFDGSHLDLSRLTPSAAINLDAPPQPVNRLHIRFVTPTELKAGHELAERPEFPILFARLRDRISTLRALYGPGPLEIDFRALAARAAEVRLTRCELAWTKVDRRSARTAQTHPLGGFTGLAEYEGPLTEFLPYLNLGKWTGVGRQTVWGKGELTVESGL